MDNRNFFDEMMKMQKNIFENQYEDYKKFMDNFKIGNFNSFSPNMFMNNFNNPMDIFKNYNTNSKKFEDMFREFFENAPGYQETKDMYGKNVELLNKLYLAYAHLYNDLDIVNSQNNLLDVFEIYSDELYKSSKKYFNKFVPERFYQVIENFDLGKFIRPMIENSKKSIHFYEEALKSRPEILVDDVRNFYENVLDKMYEIPSIGISEDTKRKSKHELKKYLELELKLLEFAIFLGKKNNETALQAQKNYLEGLESEAGIEDFTDFYRYYIKNFEKAYKELINSKDYKDKADEIIKLVNENNEIYKNKIEERLSDLPILTTRDEEGLKLEVEKARKASEKSAKDVDAVKKENAKLAKEVEALKADKEKLVKEIESIKKELENQSVSKEIEAIKKELENLKKSK